jgi:uncharacterized protein YgiM (DUF1202 family)
MTKNQRTSPMRKGIVLLALVICLLPMLPLKAQAAAGVGGAIQGPKGVANLRAYASTEARSLAVLSNGARVTALWQQNGWYYVQAGGQKGFMAGYLVRLDGPQPPTPFMTAYVNTASRGNLNVRQSPDQNAAIAGVLPYGAKMTVYAQKDGWALISAGWLEGYVNRSHLAF